MSVNTKMKALADAIRAKTNTTDLLSLDEMPTLVLSISGGGGSGEDVAVPILIPFSTKEEFYNYAPSIENIRSSIAWENNCAAYRATSTKSIMQRYDSTGFADGSKYKIFKLRYCVPTSTIENGHAPQVRLVWNTVQVSAVSTNAVKPIEDGIHDCVINNGYRAVMIADGEWHNVYFDLSTHTKWDDGIITRLQISFEDKVDGVIYISEYGVIESVSIDEITNLAAPTIALNGDILTITPATTGSTPEFYRLYDTEYGQLGDYNSLEIDLSNAQYHTSGSYDGWWEDLPSGEHTIYVCAGVSTDETTDGEINGYRVITSEASNSVIYDNVQADVETYSFTETIAIGEEKTFWAKSHSDGIETPEITSFEIISNNGVVEIVEEPENFTVTGLKAGTAIVKCTVVNYDSSYASCTATSTYTITVTDSASSGDTGDTISFNLDLYDVDGTTYQERITCQADSGMTFAQWVESDYTNDSSMIDEGYANEDYPEGWVMYNHDENGDTYWVLVQPSDVIANGATYKADRY